MLSTILNVLLPENIGMGHIAVQFFWVAITLYFSLLVDGREEEFPSTARIMKVSRVALIIVTFFYISYYNMWC